MWEVALVTGAGLAMCLLFVVVRGSLSDDAYITLAYAKNLALHLHWGLIPQEFANTATSPLHVVLLGAVSAVTRLGGGVHPVLALGVVSTALAALMAWGWVRIARALELPVSAAALGIALVLVNPFVLSAIGLEVMVIAALLVVLLAMAVEGRAGWFGIVAGLALLARIDLIVFVLPVALATPRIRSGAWRALGGGAAVALPWFAFSWLAFGSAVPDTLFLKGGQKGVFGDWSYPEGPVMYANGVPVATVLAFLPALLGLVALAAWLVRREPALAPAAALGAGGVAYYAVYSALEVGPYHWYFVPPMVGLGSFLVIAAAARVRLGLAAAGLLVLGALLVDAGHGLPWRSPVVFGNFASASEYARVGTELGARIGSATVASPGEIGTLAYFCDCAIVDEFSDRGELVRELNRYDRTHGFVRRTLFGLNYLWLDRDQRPRPVDYRLHYRREPGPGRDVWRVRSAARGVGHIMLAPAPPGWRRKLEDP